jgi:simple sugar transport system permease protein
VCLFVGPAIGWPAIPLAVLAAAAGGAVWALVPGWIFMTRGSHVVITTIMFNFIASAVMTFLIVNVLIAPGQSSPESVAFPPSVWMPSLGGRLGPSPLNVTFPLSLVLAGAVAAFLRVSRSGFEIRATGANPDAARAAGISVATATILALTLGGAFAGLVAVNELMGSQHRLLLDFPTGYGFMGIAVAMMGRNRPFGICLAALFFGALYQGGTELSFDMPKVTRDIVVVIEGLAVLFCGALENLFRTGVARWLRLAATAR